MSEQFIQQLADQDLMPGTDVVQDFYKTEKIDPSLEDQWQPIAEEDLDSLEVPGYPDICPYKAWRVITGSGTWMIYTWYDEPFGTDDDAWLYVKEIANEE